MVLKIIKYQSYDEKRTIFKRTIKTYQPVNATADDCAANQCKLNNLKRQTPMSLRA